MTDQIHQDVRFDASPARVFAELVDSGAFAAFTGAPAQIDPAPGGEFSLFGGQIQGRNIEVVPVELIVQAWRVAGWDRGVYSVARFQLRPDGAGTALSFDHVGFPSKTLDDLAAGWHAMYWEPMRAHLDAG